ncbi:MAG: nitroreductase family protein [Caldilineaceae bacterium]
MTIEEIVAIKAAATAHPIHELLAQRWSPRAFAPHPVETAKLRSILEAARWAASGGNMQPWAFIVARRDADADAHARMVSCLSEGNVPWASQAPVLGITVASLYRRPEVRNRHAYHDVGLATQNMAIQATALGLHLHLMGGFSPEQARTAFAIPADHEAVTMFALGYLGNPEQLSERHQEGERALRTRRPLAEFVFSDTWGERASLLTE